MDLAFQRIKVIAKVLKASENKFAAGVCLIQNHDLSRLYYTLDNRQLHLVSKIWAQLTIYTFVYVCLFSP